MTKEELEKEAEESFEQYKVTDEDYVVSPYSEDMGEKMLMFNYEYEAEETYLRLYTQGYLAGAEPREKRIAELETRCNELFLQTMQLTKAKEIIKELYEGLDKLYLSGLSDKQIAFIERLQDKTEQFLSEVEK